MVTFQPRVRRTLTDDGFATPTALTTPQPAPAPLPATDPFALPPDRDDEAPRSGAWLDDPAYEVEAWLLGLAERPAVQP